MLVLRYSENIENDIARGWSGWAYPNAGSIEEAAAQLEGVGVERRYEDQGDEEFCDENGIWLDDQIGRYRIFHHWGLSCYRLGAETVEDAVEEFEAGAAAGRYGEDGWATVGDVTHIVEIAPGWHILECDDVVPEV